jgi:formylglycine-generating enzyme required for sulfatase activity
VKRSGLAVLLIFIYSIVSAQSSTEFSLYEITIPSSTVKFKMLPVPGGNYKQGSAADEKGRRPDEGPQHTISVAPFWMSEHEVTYDEFLLFFNDENTSRNSDVDAVTRQLPSILTLVGVWVNKVVSR